MKRFCFKGLDGQDHSVGMRGVRSIPSADDQFSTVETDEQASTESDRIESETTLGDDECEPSTMNTTGIGKPKSLRFSCDKCDRTFSHKDSVRRHKLLHCGRTTRKRTGEVACDKCQKRFSSTHSLNGHIRLACSQRKRRKPEPRLVCYECGKKFSTKPLRDAHMKLHSNESLANLDCNVCKKTFKNKKELRTHERVHTGELIVSCDECGESFANKYTLEYHKRLHAGLKLYVCDLCGKSFSLKSVLTLHLRSHRAIKPFACDECKMKFAEKGKTVYTPIHTIFITNRKVNILLTRKRSIEVAQVDPQR